MQRSVILSCPTLKRELEAAMEIHASGAPVYYLPQRLHNDPKELHCYLQDMIDNFYNVDRIVICTSRCGGSTANLRATSAELVLPRTRDCLDILLSGENLGTIKRNIKGIYFTASWMDFSKKSEIDLNKLTEKMGRNAAISYLKQLYKSFNEFYIIDTGCYDIQEVKDYITPLVEILHGSITVIPGNYGILHKIAQEQFDEDFVIIPKYSTVPGNVFLENK